MLTVLQRFGLFATNLPRTLQNIANNDLATQDIEDDLLAPQKGPDQLDVFVRERLMPSTERSVSFRDKLTQNKYFTFSSLFEVKQSDTKTGKAKTVKADRNILHRLITAYEAGRTVNLDNVMMHKLFVVPLSLAEVHGQLCSGSKAIFAKVLTADIPCPSDLKATDLQCEPVLVIDGQALIISIGKPQAKTFGDLADTSVESVLQSGSQFQQLDVLFDHYHEHSIKGGTRKWRGKGSVAIRRPVTNRDLPLPAKWENFIVH